MGKTLLTGGAGFVGSHVARALLERGDDLKVTVRQGSARENLTGLECELVNCDVLDRRAVTRAMRGVDRVFHVAGLTSLRASAERLFEVNVEGTRNVLLAARKAGVERVVYTSSVAAVGPAPSGGTADERQLFNAERFGIPYVNAKHEAEVEAFRIGATGLPVVAVNPAFVFGAGDVNRSSTEIVRRFMLRRIPAYTDGALNVVDVRDVAAGHLLADERGEPGERYILGGRNFTLDRLFADLGRLSGIEPPAVKLPLRIALALATVSERMPGRPQVTTVETRASSLWWTYRNNKARRELGFKARPHEETLSDTVSWYVDRESDRLARTGAGQPAALKLAGGALRTAQRLAGWV